MMKISFCFLIILPWLALAQDILRKEILLSSPRTNFTSIEVNGKIYFAGGFENGDRASSTIDVFDIATQTWDNTLQLFTPRGFVTPAVIPPHIYFIGGFQQLIFSKSYLYDPITPSFNNLESSSIKEPLEVAIYGTTFVVLGEYGAQFTNLTDVGYGWSSREALDSTLQRVAGGIKFSHENLIFIFGGVNVSSRQPVSDAWIYDITTDNLTRYENALNPIGYVSNTDYTHSVTGNIMAAWSDTNCILFNPSTDTWLNFNVFKLVKVLSVPGFTFMWSASGYYTVDWNDTTADPTFTSTSVTHRLGFADQVAFFNGSFDGSSSMFCTNNGVDWSVFSVPALSIVTMELEWPSQGSVFVTDQGFYVFRNCSSVEYVPQTQIVNIVLDQLLEQLLVIFQNTAGAEANKFYVQKWDLVNGYDIDITVIPFSPNACFGNVLFNFIDTEAWSLANTSAARVFGTDLFGPNTLWAARGKFFVALVPGSTVGPFMLSSLVDIYNYENSTWMKPTSHASIGQAYDLKYFQTFNANGRLVIMTNDGQLQFDIATYNWTIESPPFKNVNPPTALIEPLAIEVNGISYVVSADIRLRIVANGTQTLSTTILETIGTDSGADSETPVQMIYSSKLNQILISTSTNNIFTWNIDNQRVGLYLFPRPEEPEFIMATSGNFILACSKSLEVLDYGDLSTSQWGFVTNVTNYFRPSTMRSFTFNGTDLILTAGGQDKMYSFHTDSVRIFDISSLQSIPAPPIPKNDTETPADTLAPLSEADTNLIIGIVVPVGAVLIGGGLLAFFLIRRNNNKKKRSTAMSTMGLEQQYGQWFIPFTFLTFHEQLGQGATGQVFKGTWNNTTVALKLSMTQANNSVIDELTLMMQLRPHPNVVQLLGFSVHPETDSIVLVIEYCNQGALDDILFNNNTPVSLKQKLEWLIGIAKGLSHLHSNNIVHRDVAARNVLMHQNEAKLTDFGMSRIVDSQQQRGTTKSELGPIRWMSPESLKSKEYSTKSDVWSFGIVAYEIITQQEPHTSADPIQIGQQIRDSGLTPQLPDTCPSEVSTVIKSCWHMVPSQRPSIEEITSRLESTQI